MKSRILVVASALALAGCGAARPAPSYLAYAPKTPLTLRASTPASDADALVDAIYDAPKRTADWERIQPALRLHPDDAGLHEIAAYDATLRGDAHGAFEHFVRAAADTRAVATELYLHELMALATTTSEHLEAESLLRALAASHPKPDVRALATHFLGEEALRFGEAGEAARAIAALGFVRDWAFIGPFDNDEGSGFLAPYAPEASGERTPEVPGSARLVKWRRLSLAPNQELLPLSDLVFPTEAVAYAESVVVAAAPVDVELRLTVGASARAWLDGRLVASDDRLRREALDNLRAKVHLEAGSHRLLLKIARSGGTFAAGARFTDATGEVARGLTFASALGRDAKPVETSIDLPTSRKPTFEGVKSLHRTQLLTARSLSFQGAARSSRFDAEAYLAKAPGNPLALYEAALALWDADEAGRALDLLNRGVLEHPFATGILLKRGRFYAQRKLWAKAATDFLRARKEQPEARAAYVETSAMFGARGRPLERCLVLGEQLARWPDSPSAEVERGLCNEEQGLFADALEHYRRAVALMPGQVTALRRLARAASRRLDDAEALRILRALRALYPTTLELGLEEAEVLTAARRGDEARAVLEALSLQDPDWAPPYARRADLDYASGRLDRARPLYAAASERDPDDQVVAERVASLGASSLPTLERLAPSDAEIEAAIKRAASIAPNPGAQAAVLMDDLLTEVNADGSSRSIATQVELALNTEGRDQLIQATLPQGGNVKVIEAYSIKKSGERSEASSITNGVVRYRSLDVGSIVVRRYSWHASSHYFLPHEYQASAQLGRVGMQVESARYRVLLQPGQDLVFQAWNIQARKTELEGRPAYEFSLEHAAPLENEPQMTSDPRFRVQLSTLLKWDDYVAWERGLLRDALQSNPRLEALAKDLVKDAKTPREKLDRLIAYVAEEIRYQQDYEAPIAGVRPHPASVVLERGYGDCKDKAVLLMRLAKVLGLEVRFALLKTMPVGVVAASVPSSQFNHAIAFVPAQPGLDKGFFVDTTTNGLDLGNLRLDDQGAHSLVLDPLSGKFELLDIPYSAPEDESEKVSLALDWKDPQRAVGALHVELRGSAASSHRRTLRNKELAHKAHGSLVERLFPGASLTREAWAHDQEITRPLGYDLGVDLSGAVAQDPGEARLRLPLGFPLVRSSELAARKTALAMERQVVTETLELELAVAKDVARLPPEIDVQHACFTFSRKVAERGSKIVVTTTYRATCARLEPADYPAFRAAVQKVNAHRDDALAVKTKVVKALAAAKP